MMPLINIVPMAAFMKRGMDFMGPFKMVMQRKNKYIVVAPHCVTKWEEAKALSNNNAKITSWFLFN